MSYPDGKYLKFACAFLVDWFKNEYHCRRSTFINFSEIEVSCQYRKSSNKRPGAYSIFESQRGRLFEGALIRGGAYSRIYGK